MTIPNRVDVLILAPTAVEWSEMVRHIENPVEDNESLPATRGTIGNCSVVCYLSGKGQGETAATLSTLIERFMPKKVFLVGIAGGFVEMGVHRGDLVVAHTVWNFDYGKVTQGNFLRRPEHDYNCDRVLLSQAEIVAADDLWVESIKLPSVDERKPRAHTDCYVASADKVVDDPNDVFFARIAQGFPEIHAVEMEAAGAGASIRLAQSSMKIAFIMIRGISDEPGTIGGAGSAERQRWRPYAASVAAAFTSSVIRRL